MTSSSASVTPTPLPSDRRALIAIDLGAESCRVSLLRWTESGPELRLVHRFPNGPVRADDGSVRWPLDAILAGVEHGIQLCAVAAPEGIRSLAIDGWAVDYVRLGPRGELLAQPFCYRDGRTGTASAALHRRLPAERMREITGVELQPLNTLYQLYADRLAGEPPTRWLNLPEYLLHRLGAEPVSEYSNASHTQMLDLYGGNWSREILEAAMLEPSLMPRIVPPGTLLGRLAGPLAGLPGLGDTELIAPACHDTASAIAGIAEPQTGTSWAYISCGTWSLVGAVLPRALNGPAVREDNFTNLGAVGGRVCFHKGVNGMWLLKQCMDHWAAADESSRAPWTLENLLAAAAALPAPDALLEVDDPSLGGLGQMPARINAQRTAAGLPALPEGREDAPAMVSLLLHSLATRYAAILSRLEFHTGRRFSRIVMVGGGSRNAMLRRLTEEATGVEVVTGPAESSTIGNLAVQLAVLESDYASASSEFARSVTEWASRLAPDLEGGHLFASS